MTSLRRGLVVSCQAHEDSPMRAPEVMGLMARSAELGGAIGIRADGPADISAIKKMVQVPIIGLYKRATPGTAIYITPVFQDAVDVVAAGADFVALDATTRLRADGMRSADFIRLVIDRLGIPVVADIDSFAAGIAAAAAGAQYVATTLAGRLSEPRLDTPDIDLVRRLSDSLECGVLAEGGYRTVEQVGAAFEAGAFAVVVGEAITDPIAITRRLSRGIPSRAGPGGE